MCLVDDMLNGYILDDCASKNPEYNRSTFRRKIHTYGVCECGQIPQLQIKCHRQQQLMRRVTQLR